MADNPMFGTPGEDKRLRYDPHADRWSCPTTVDGDHIYGHITPINVCLRGRADRCVTPPDADLGGFMRHHAPFANGQRTGVITLGSGGHGDIGVGVIAATQHYDKTDRAGADVRVGRDAYGIWFAGMIRPGLSKNDRYALAASGVSGHWEPGANGRMTLVGLPAVNTEGYGKGYLTAEEVASGIAASAGVSTVSFRLDEGLASGSTFPEGEWKITYGSDDDCGCDDAKPDRLALLEAKVAHLADAVLTVMADD
jgi:hypothetical protein